MTGQGKEISERKKRERERERGKIRERREKKKGKRERSLWVEEEMSEQRWIYGKEKRSFVYERNADIILLSS